MSHNEPISPYHQWFANNKISPRSIPNSQKQKQLPNTQWVKYVYCPALLTLEVGRARRNHGTNAL